MAAKERGQKLLEGIDKYILVGFWTNFLYCMFHALAQSDADKGCTAFAEMEYFVIDIWTYHDLLYVYCAEVLSCFAYHLVVVLFV